MSKKDSHEYLFQEELEAAVNTMFMQPDIRAAAGDAHCHNTPKRVAKAMLECFEGCFEEPADKLNTLFPSEGSEMIYVGGARFISYCAHHLMPFVGTYTFAYVPDNYIVGLSKIPRMIKVLCARPQVQEKLSREIVTTFQKTVHPRGCAVTMDATHFCMCSRGVKEYAVTRTTALEGIFATNPEVKAEFLATIGQLKGAF